MCVDCMNAAVADASRVRGASDSQAKCARRVRGASGGDQVHSIYPVTLRMCMTTAFRLSVEAFVVTVASDGASC